MFIPEVKEIIHRESKRGEFFTVVWSDNVQTTVKLAEGEKSDEYTAFLYALGKRIFGNKGKARAYVKAGKEVFENRMEHRSREKLRQRKAQSLQRQLEAEDVEFISSTLNENIFVAPCLVSREVFRRNNR